MIRHIRFSIVLAGAGCLAEPDSVVPGQIEQAVIAERPGQVEYAFRNYANANIARVQLAAPKWQGCSATMIGPNIVLTAAHCGPAEAEEVQTAPLTFMTY